MRARKKPVDPTTVKRMVPRGNLATASKNWRWVVDATSKTNWNANSKFLELGQLEYVGIVMAAQIAGLARPTDRSSAALPAPPGIVGWTYIGSPFALKLSVPAQLPAGATSIIYSATPPTPPTSRPSFGDRRVIKSGTFSTGVIDLTTDYLNTFNGKSPDGRSLMLGIEIIKSAIPADSRMTNFSTTRFDPGPAATGWVSGSPFQKMGTVPVTLEPNFGSQLPGTAIALTITANDLTSAFAATIPNVVSTTSSIADTLGIRRDVNFDFLFESLAGEKVTLPMGATVTI